MKILTVRKRLPESIPVFILFEGSNINRHLLFTSLTEADQQFIHAFLAKSPLKDGYTHLIFLPSKNEALLVGAPQQAVFTHRKAMLMARKIISIARKEKVRRITVALDDFRASGTHLTRDEVAEIMATQFEIANFEFTRYKTPPASGWMFVEEVALLEKKPSPRLLKAVQSGKIIGEEINNARALANTPGMDMTPEHLGDMALIAGKEYGFDVQVLDEKAMQKLGMSAVLGVGKGSMHKPRFIIIEYLKGKKAERPIALVGKGVTFDSGGLNLKPSAGLADMHMDMSGGAAVIRTIAAAARLKVRKNIVGIVPAVENMISGESYRPQDVLKTMSGKTIEIKDTDAEGRVILADALTYAKRYDPRVIVDVATLTGASAVALGERASAFFTNHAGLEKQFREIGEKTGDFVWPLPLWEEYEEEIKGTFGDVQNLGRNDRRGGAITGAVFLWQFVKDPIATRDKRKEKGNASVLPWVHLDVAPRTTSIEGEFLAKGAIAPGTALMVYFIRSF